MPTVAPPPLLPAAPVASPHVASCAVPSLPVPVDAGVSVPTLVPVAPGVASRVPRSLCQHQLVPSVSVPGAEMADEALVSAAESLQSLAVAGAEPHLVLGGVDHLVALPRVEAGVELEVRLTVRGDTHQARFDGLLLSTGADVALHVPGPGVAPADGGGPEAGPLQPLHHLREHGVLVEGWSGLKGLPALGTATHTSGLLLVPAVLDAVHAVAVSTRYGHRVLQWIQADWTAEGVLVFQNSIRHVAGFCHSAAHLKSNPIKLLK